MYTYTRICVYLGTPDVTIAIGERIIAYRSLQLRLLRRPAKPYMASAS